MTVMVRCYLLCLLTLALCCACGLVWADSPKASDALIKPSTVGVPSLVRRAIPEDAESWMVYEDEEDGDRIDEDRHRKKEQGSDKVEKTTISKPSTVSRSMGSEGSLGPQEIPVNSTVLQQHPPPPLADAPLASSHDGASAEGKPGAVGVDGLPGSPGVERSDMSESSR
ncbi:uncharacterized protein TM35_000601190, partial [Trypanosoma theileri]